MLPASSIHAARLDHAIRCASELSDSEDAIRRIGSLWQTVDSLASLAESRMRALLARVKGPELTPEPSWLTAAGRELLGACDAESGAPSRAALESCEPARPRAAHKRTGPARRSRVRACGIVSCEVAR